MGRDKRVKVVVRSHTCQLNHSLHRAQTNPSSYGLFFGERGTQLLALVEAGLEKITSIRELLLKLFDATLHFGQSNLP